MNKMRDLRAAVDELYIAFKQYRLREHIEGCPCCVGEGDQRKIRAVPLEELSSEQLRRYTFKAMTTWGTADHFRHFFPRIAELIAFDAEWPLELEIATGKLTHANWNVWPAHERVAVRRFFEAWWDAALSEFPCRRQWQSIDEVLCAIGRAEDALSEYLDTWLQSPGLAPKRHLADFITDNYKSLSKKGLLVNEFWMDRDIQRQSVEAWLRSDAVRRTLQEASTAEDESLQYEVLQAIEYLDWLDPTSGN